MKQSEFHKIQGIVREVIFEWKPFSWMPEDINDPEFDGEIIGIAKQFERIQSPNDAAAVISRIFRSSFGDSDRFHKNSCKEAGKSLYQRLVNEGLKGE